MHDRPTSWPAPNGVITIYSRYFHAEFISDYRLVRRQDILLYINIFAWSTHVNEDQYDTYIHI